MDASSEPYPELPYGWDSDFLCESYLDTSEMFELPDACDPFERTHTSSNDSMAAEDIAFLLNFGSPEFDTSNVFRLRLTSEVETSDVNQVSLNSPSGLRSPFESESSTMPIQSAEGQELAGPRMDDFLGEFEITQPHDPISLRRNHRRAYPPEKKMKVERVRKMGACVRCRLLKRPCTDGLLCDGCRKICGRITLASALCVRRKLLDVRSVTDLWDRQRDLSWVKQEIPLCLASSKRIVQLSFWDLCDTNIFLERTNNNWDDWDGGHDGRYILPKPFEIEVQDFVPHPGRQNRHSLEVFENGDHAIPAEHFYYAIPEVSLPTLESLETWIFEVTRFKRRAIFGDSLHGAFMSLARRYFECERPLPLSDLMQKVVRLSCLHGLWCSALQEPRTSRQQKPIYASKAVHVQISVIISRGIEVLERDILGQLQDTIFHTKGPGRSNRLPIYITLWILMLTYRRTILFSYSELDSSGNNDLAQSCCQHMYEMLISIYSALFRPSSPLWLNFLEDEVFELFGRDFRIIERLGTVKTEVCYIINSTSDEQSFLSPRDALLRKLVLDNEKRLGGKAYEKPV